jgi:hypothetical protein
VAAQQRRKASPFALTQYLGVFSELRHVTHCCSDTRSGRLSGVEEGKAFRSNTIFLPLGSVCLLMRISVGASSRSDFFTSSDDMVASLSCDDFCPDSSLYELLEQRNVNIPVASDGGHKDDYGFFGLVIGKNHEVIWERTTKSYGTAKVSLARLPNAALPS